VERLTVRQIECIIAGAKDPDFTSAMKGVYTLLVRHADEAGVVGTNPNGRSLAEVRHVAAALRLGESTVHKAFADLNRRGRIVWERAPLSSRHRNRGLTGTIRIVFPAAS
jgi:hypothetical protein